MTDEMDGGPVIPDEPEMPSDDTGLNAAGGGGGVVPGVDPNPQDPPSDVKDPRTFQSVRDLTQEERITQLEIIMETLWDDFELRRLASGDTNPPDPLRDGIDRWLKRINARRTRRVPNGG